MADKVRGWLRKRKRVDGMAWVWCYEKLRRRGSSRHIGLAIGLRLSRKRSRIVLSCRKDVVGDRGFEPLTSTV